MGIDVFPIELTKVQIVQVWDLIQKSYEQRRRDSGVEFNLLKYTFEDFEKKISQENLIILVALDEKHHLLGTRTLKLHNKGKTKYSEGMWLAVDPDVQGKGVGSKLLSYGSNYVYEMGCGYVIEDTALTARSSVIMHEKNKYYVVGLASFSSTNYFSFVFRHQLKPRFSLYKNKQFCHLCFLFSYVLTKMVKKENGDYTLIGKMINLIR